MDEILKEVTGKFENLEMRLEVVKEKESRLRREAFNQLKHATYSVGLLFGLMTLLLVALVGSRSLKCRVFYFTVFNSAVEIMVSFLIFYFAFVRIQKLKEDLVKDIREKIPTLRDDIMSLTVKVAAFMELQESTFLVPTKELLIVKLKKLKMQILKNGLHDMEKMVNEMLLCEMSVANWDQKMIIYLAFASAEYAVILSIVSHMLFCR